MKRTQKQGEKKMATGKRNIWKKTRGYKTIIGAIITLIVNVLPMFGVEVPDGLNDSLINLSTIIIGTGLADKLVAKRWK